VDAAAIDRATGLVLQSAARGLALTPSALTLLVRRYAATGRDDIRAVVESALNDVVEWAIAPPADRRGTPPSAWIQPLVEATAISDDERLVGAIGAVAGRLRNGWPARGAVADALSSVDACLSAAAVLPATSATADLVRQGIDELERVVGAAYEPGEGLAHSLDHRRDDMPTLRDQIDAAAALLSAFGVTDRLPYAMLAEELVQFGRRRWWDETHGAYAGEEEDNCRAVRALCRLALLLEEPNYRDVAVTAPRADYAADARRIVDWLARRHDASPDLRPAGEPTAIADEVERALAFEEFFRRRLDLQ
jgi:hypothetical protein